MFNNIFPDKEIPHNGETLEGEMKKNVGQNISFKEVRNKKKIDDNKLLFPIHVNFDEPETHEELYKKVKEWWINTKGQAEKTINNYINTMRMCHKHPIYPIDWFKFDETPEQCINLQLYLKNIEYPEKGKKTGRPNYGIHHLHNIKKALNMMADAKGVDISWWGWSPPSRPENKVKIVPRPITVNEMIHHKYTKDKITNALIKTILTVGFNTGLRPEELIKLQIRYVFFDTSSIILSEEKKRYRNRQLRLDPPVMYSKKQNSLYNWINIWRPRIKNSEKNSYVFLQKNGRPFPSSDAFRNFLVKKGIKKIWKSFSPKKMRDWNAIARLIRTKIKTGHWDIREVTKKLGHKYQNTTDGYVEFAELYYENDKFDWLSSVLKHQKCLMQEYRPSQKDVKSSNRKKRPGLNKSYLLEKMLPTGCNISLLLLRKSSKIKFLTSLFKSFFFSLHYFLHSATNPRGWDADF